MASIRPRQHRDGRWWYNVRFKLDGRETSVTWPDEKSANQFRVLVESVGGARAMEIHDIHPTARTVSTGYTVKEWLQHHIDHLTGLEKKTVSEYRRYARQINEELGDIPLKGLARADVARWLNSLSGSGKTISNKHGFLSHALKTAVKDGVIAGNPCEGQKIPRTPKAEMVMLTREEFLLLHGCFTEHYKPLVEFLVASGARFSEAAALTPADVDLTHHTVRIAKAWKHVPGVGIELGAPKTARSTRTINVPESVLRNLAYDREWLFVNSRGGPVRIYGWRENVWYPAVRKAAEKGLTKKPRVHDLRHTCASWMIAANIPLPVIQRHLGHESIKTTVDLYGHFDRKSSREAADAIAAILNRPAP